ncbi:YgeY family selenium metabolism-linked hydrolase [bacterium]|nr:YgeY family selenium metabolism-linked hydrolase [bacterium]
MNKILELAEKYENDVANFLVDIVKIPSLSGQEKDVVERISTEMKKVGFDEVWVDGLGSVVGRIGDGPFKLAFDAHIDTVDVGNRANWDFDPYDAHIKDGKVWGRGGADQKGGMASMVYAGKIIKELGLAKNCTIYMVGSVMEEDCDGLCWDYLIKEENLKPDLCVITEPTSLNIYRGHRGRMEIKVHTKGVSCHGSAPERGENAIYKMANTVLGIEKLNERITSDEFLGKGTVTVSEITSVSPSLCAVADGASIHLDRRLTWGETEESAVQEVKEVAGIDKDATVEVPVYEGKGYTGKVYPMKKYYPTWKLPEENEFVQTAITSYKNVFNKDPKVDKWTFSTNGVAIMGINGVPCFGFGPGHEEQAHTPNEWTPVDHLVKATAFYAQFAEEMSN